MAAPGTLLLQALRQMRGRADDPALRAMLIAALIQQLGRGIVDIARLIEEIRERRERQETRELERARLRQLLQTTEETRAERKRSQKIENIIGSRIIPAALEALNQGKPELIFARLRDLAQKGGVSADAVRAFAIQSGLPQLAVTADARRLSRLLRELEVRMQKIQADVAEKTKGPKIKGAEAGAQRQVLAAEQEKLAAKAAEIYRDKLAPIWADYTTGRLSGNEALKKARAVLGSLTGPAAEAFSRFEQEIYQREQQAGGSIIQKAIQAGQATADQIQAVATKPGGLEELPDLLVHQRSNVVALLRDDRIRRALREGDLKTLQSLVAQLRENFAPTEAIRSALLAQGLAERWLEAAKTPQIEELVPSDPKEIASRIGDNPQENWWLAFALGPEGVDYKAVLDAARTVITQPLYEATRKQIAAIESPEAPPPARRFMELLYGIAPGEQAEVPVLQAPPAAELVPPPWRPSAWFERRGEGRTAHFFKQLERRQGKAIPLSAELGQLANLAKLLGLRGLRFDWQRWTSAGATPYGIDVREHVLPVPVLRELEMPSGPVKVSVPWFEYDRIRRALAAAVLRELLGRQYGKYFEPYDVTVP